MLNDLRHAFRSLRRRPGSTALGVTALALGIGANAAILSFAERIVLRPLPFTSADRQVDLRQSEGLRSTGSLGAEHRLGFFGMCSRTPGGVLVALEIGLAVLPRSSARPFLCGVSPRCPVWTLDLKRNECWFSVLPLPDVRYRTALDHDRWRGVRHSS